MRISRFCSGVSDRRHSTSATVSLGGVSKQISLALVDDADLGDFVLVHVGYALNKISPDEAERTLRLLREAGASVEDAA